MGVADILQKLPSIVITLVVFYVIGIAGYAVYLFINRKDQNIVPPVAWWWPSALNQYVHVYARNYTYLSNVTAPTSFVSNTYSNVSAIDCKAKCEDSPDECVGFESNLASNTCVTYSSIGYPVQYSGNTLYVVEGNEPVSMYMTYSGQQANSNTIASSNVTSSDMATNYVQCSGQCSAKPDCKGFEYNNSVLKSCTMYTTMDSSNLTANTTITSYVLQPAVLGKSPI